MKRSGGVVAVVVVATALVMALVTEPGAPAGAQAWPGSPEPPPPADAPPEVIAAQRWVRAAVLDLLGRPAPEAEVATLAGRLAAGTPRGTIAKELARSDEWVGAVVTDLYQHILGRDPEPAGLAYWVDRLQGGDRVASVAVSIYAADEYYADAGGTPGDYVDALYESILDRAPDVDGRAFWVDRLESGVNRWRVAKELFLSFEARGRRVDALYRSLLGRAASLADRSYWAGRLATEDDIVLAAHLVASAEYEARAQTRPETVGPTRPPAATGGELGVSGDGATVVRARGGYFQADLEAVDSTSGHVDQVHDIALVGWLVPLMHLSRPSVSDDGRFITVSDSVYSFEGHPGGGVLIDRLTGTTTPLGGAAKAYEPTISPDGSTVVYRQRGGTTDDIVTYDVAGGVATVVVAGNGHSAAPRLSGDGRYVVFTSGATDLVAGDDNGQPDVFVHDRTADTMTRLTDGNGPSGQPWISADGSTVAFTSTATDLVAGDTADDGPAEDLYVWDRASGTIERASDGTTSVGPPSVSGDGEHVAFAQDVEGNGAGDRASVWDRSTGTVTVLGEGVTEVQVTTDGGEVVGYVQDQTGTSYPRWSLADVDRLTLDPEPLPPVQWDEPYSAELEVTGGPGAEVVDAQLPEGLALVGQTITGTYTGRPAPTAITLVLEDDDGRRTVRRLVLDIDGPGTLEHIPVEDARADIDVTPDGEVIAYVRDLGSLDSEVRTRTASGTDTLVADGIGPSISDDGTQVAFFSREPLVPEDSDDQYDAYLAGPGGITRLAGGTPGSGAVRGMALSGDGSTAVVATEADEVVAGEDGPGTYVVDTATGAATRLTDDFQAPVAISRDGSVVVTAEPSATPGRRQVVRFEGGTETVVGEVVGNAVLDVSADGDHIVFGTDRQSSTQPELRLWSADTGTTTVIDAGQAREVAISDDGSVVMFQGGAGPDGLGRTGDMHRWERATGEVTWAVTRQTVEEPTGSGVARLALTGDGATVFFTSDEALLPAAEGNPAWDVFSWTAPT